MSQAVIEEDWIGIRAVAKVAEVVQMFRKPYRVETVETGSRIATTKSASPSNHGNSS